MNSDVFSSSTWGLSEILLKYYWKRLIHFRNFVIFLDLDDVLLFKESIHLFILDDILPFKESYRSNMDDVHPFKESYHLIFLWTMYIHLRNLIVLFFLWTMYIHLRNLIVLFFLWTMFIHLRNLIVLFFSGRCLCFLGYVHSWRKKKITRIHGSLNNTFI